MNCGVKTTPPCTQNAEIEITNEPACSCRPAQDSCIDTYPIAMAYVPMQKWGELYDPMSALSHGTIFRELDLPWYPTNCGGFGKECRR